jgi:hypothetical protein
MKNFSKNLVRSKEEVFKSLLIMLDYYVSYLDTYKDVNDAKIKFLETYHDYYNWLQGVK